MINELGNPVTGHKFFQRDSIINEIYERLNIDSHIFLAAPRRAGKTSIMYHLRDKPRSNYHFIYVVVQSVESEEEFWQRIYDEVYKHRKRNKALKWLTQSRWLSFLKNIRISEIKLPVIGGGVVLDKKAAQIFKKLSQLLFQIGKQNHKTVLMIDELPDCLLNIKNKQGNNLSAISLLQRKVELRRTLPANLRFIYTGSISLPVAVKAITSTQIIADLSRVEVSPLTAEEGADFLTKLAEDPINKLQYEANTIPYLIQKIEWLMPHQLQLVFHQLRVLTHNGQSVATPKTVDTAIDELLKYNNKTYFEHYYLRKENDLVAINLLNAIAQNEYIETNTVREIATASDCKNYQDLIESLIFEGYIHENQHGQFRFNGAILRLWWLKFVAHTNPNTNA